MIPSLTREARDWLLEKLAHYIDGAMCVGRAEIIRVMGSMPLAPADPLDAVRARFQSNGIQEITATDGDYALGYNGGYVTVWRVQDGAHWLGRGPAKPLQCLSPHAALIAELRNVSGVYSSITADLLKRAADALQNLEVK